MRFYLAALFFITQLGAAGLDTKLYEGSQREDYYKEIQKQIEVSQIEKRKPQEILQNEKSDLARLRSASLLAIQIDLYDYKALTKESVRFESYYSAINAVASLRVKQELSRKMLKTVNEKLMFLKKAVENIVEEEKPRLLSYQLQYAYYKLQEKNIVEKLQLLQTHEQEIMGLLFNALALLECDSIDKIDDKILSIDKEIEKASLQKVSLQIDLEKALIEDNTKIGQLQQKMLSAEISYQQLLNENIALKVQKSLCMLQAERNSLFFKLIDEIELHVKEISGELFPIYIEQQKILREISKDVFGPAKLFLAATLHESKLILSDIKGYFISPIFVFNEQPISLLSIFKALMLIVLGLLSGRLYKRWIARISRKWPDVSQMSIRLASNIGYYLIVIISFIIAIGSLGIDMTSISLIAGALSIGIGFGLQTVVSNMIAGIILMFERTIRIGDTIEISETLRGRVTDMRIRSTTIKTFDNIDIVIPNSSFIQNNVINWTLDDISRRVHIPFDVAYGTDVDSVKKIILSELEQSSLKYIRNDADKEPEVWMTAMSSSSVDFELLVWVEWDNRLRPNSLKSDFLILIYKTLNKHGIQIPFPQLDVHVKNMPS